MNELFPGGYLKTNNRFWTTHYGKEVRIVDMEILRLNTLYTTAIVTIKQIATTNSYSVNIEFKNDADEAEFILRETS